MAKALTNTHKVAVLTNAIIGTDCSTGGAEFGDWSTIIG